MKTMIKANELRKGNLLWHNEQVIEVKNIYDGIVTINSDSIALRDCQGIPLTPEWMERMGFEFNSNEGYFSYDLPNKPQGIDGIKVGKGVYVHQLQNLYFALTGEEFIEPDAEFTFSPL